MYLNSIVWDYNLFYNIKEKIRYEFYCIYLINKIKTYKKL